MSHTVAPPGDDSKEPRRRPLRVLVTGSRDWTDQRVIYDALDTIARCATDLTVVHGYCPKGADYWAHRWCWENLSDRVNAEPHPADWQRHGKKAGHVRNAEMAKLGADLCLAFILNRSSGSTGCAREAIGNDIPTVVFRQEYPDLAGIAAALALPEEVAR